MTAGIQGSGQAQSFSSPQEEALLSLMRTAECLHRAMQQRLKSSGLTLTQYNVLRILRSACAEGLTCSEIGRRTIAPEPDITRLLGRLKAQKLLNQQRDREDRRVVRTRISARGLEILATLDGIVEKAPRELLQDLNREEVKELTRLLGKARNCGSNGGHAESQPLATGKPPLRRSPLPPRPE